MSEAPLQLRPAQQEALKYRSGYMGISAVPGSGKTFTLEQLVLKLIEEGTPPDRIAIGTYMRSSRANLSTRLKRHLTRRHLAHRGTPEVFTLHSLALRILRRFQTGGEAIEIVEPYVKERLLDGLVKNWMEANTHIWQTWMPDPSSLKNDYKRKQLRNDIRKQIRACTNSVISTAKNYRVAPDEINTEPDTFLGWSTSIYAHYQTQLRKIGKIDYDDLGRMAVDLLESRQDVCDEVAGWFDYVLEDEAQDSSPLQEQLLGHLASKSGNLVRVGDPNQSILGTFTTADPRFFRDFCQTNQPVVLSESSRCARMILDLANYLVRWTVQDHPNERVRDAFINQQICTATSGPANPPDSEASICIDRISGSPKDEANEAAQRTIGALKDFPLHSVAVLVQTNEQGNEVLEALRERGVRCIDMLRSNFSMRRLIEQLQTLTAFFADPTSTGTLHRSFEAAAYLEGLTPAQASDIAAYLDRVQVEELLFPHLSQPRTLPALAKFDATLHLQAQAVFARLARWLELAKLPWDDVLRLLAQELSASADDLYVSNYLIEQLGRDLATEPFAEWSAVANLIADQLSKPLQNLPSEVRPYSPEPGTITVVTCHRAKGLEWDHVYVLGLSAYQFPVEHDDRPFSQVFDGNLDITAEAIAQLKAAIDLDESALAATEAAFLEMAKERMRVLYVAITRARRHLTLMVTTKDQWDRDQKSSHIFDVLADFRQSLKKPFAHSRTT